MGPGGSKRRSIWPGGAKQLAPGRGKEEMRHLPGQERMESIEEEVFAGAQELSRLTRGERAEDGGWQQGRRATDRAADE